ncbi:MAG: hypothetical protein WHS83_08320 [Chloroflexus sp.]
MSTAGAAAWLPHSKLRDTRKRAGKATNSARNGTEDGRQPFSLPYR